MGLAPRGNDVARDAAVLGAGSVGSVLAARLHQAGRDVLAVGRQEHVDAIRKDGLRVAGPEGDVASVDVPAATELEPADVIFLTVKTPDVPGAAAQAAKVGDGATLVTCQNGVQADRMAAEVVGPGRVAGGVVVFDAEFLDPGEVTLKRDGPLLLGNPWGAPTGRDRAVRDLLYGAHEVELREGLAGARWMKLLVNLNNALPAATGKSIQEVYEHGELARVATAAMQEGVEVVRGAGKPLSSIPWASRTLVTGISALPTGLAMRLTRWKVRRTLGDVPARPSTLQSVLRGGASEVDYLNGEVVRLAEEIGVAAPVNRGLVEAVQAVERRGSFLEPAEVVRRVEEKQG
jgi:2-dehydropantoate 2-reductase